MEIDAEFSVERAGAGFDVVLESRGGVMSASGKRRNTDYAAALMFLLTRMASLDLAIQQARIASSTTEALTPEQRRLDLRDHSYPVRLARLSNFEPLRLDLGRALAAFRATAESKGESTSAKRLRLSVVGTMLGEMTPDAVADALAGHAARGAAMRDAGSKFTDDHQGQGEPGRNPVWTEPLTADPGAAAKVEGPPRAEGAAAGLNWRPTGHRPDIALRPRSQCHCLGAGVADGRCEVCEQQAPFARDDGSPYLEVHHVRPLGEGGPDTVDNAVAACPNCHRRLHHGDDRLEARARTVARIGRLTNYPEAPVIEAPSSEAEGADGSAYSAA